MCEPFLGKQKPSTAIHLHLIHVDSIHNLTACLKETFSGNVLGLSPTQQRQLSKTKLLSTISYCEPKMPAKIYEGLIFLAVNEGKTTLWCNEVCNNKVHMAPLEYNNLEMVIALMQ